MLYCAVPMLVLSLPVYAAGVALKEHDVLAVARLRGPQLLVFEVLEECITSFSYGDGEFEEDFTMSFDVFCEEVNLD